MGIADPECATCDGGRAATAVSPPRGWTWPGPRSSKLGPVQILSTCVCLGGPESPFCLLPHFVRLRPREPSRGPPASPGPPPPPRKGLAVDGREAEERVCWVPT
ncbi:hypothetical protein M0657_005753 [Pyricularia oryzae]|nr:hypothetical protein M0657_005753 [Pyricularia oryzae]